MSTPNNAIPASEFLLIAAKQATPDSAFDLAGLKSRADETPDPTPFVLTASEGVVWGERAGDEVSTITKAARPGRGPHVVGFKIVRQPVGSKLLVITPDGALVNGLPALPVAVVQSGDLLSLGGVLHYVSERIRPCVGRPTEAMIASGTCGRCRLPFDERSWVCACGRCGSVQHMELDDKTPHLAKGDRLMCFGHRCPACNLPTSTDPFLTFDPHSDL